MPLPAVMPVPLPIALAVAALETPALLCLFVAGRRLAGVHLRPPETRRER